MLFNTPILLLFFNRPDTTQRVFDEIKKVQPKKLYISADGPRVGKPGEAEKCKALRDTIIRQVDWECELFTNFSDRNLGCRMAISSGIDWLFKHEERGIILEDDTLPSDSFFRFCDELLEKYRDEKRIMMISGDNFQFGRKVTEYSYYFSRYTHIWGWATWKRAWNYYDVYMKLWPEFKDTRLLLNVLGDTKEVSYWRRIFDKVYDRKIDAWSYQWLFASWLQDGLNILPQVNLVSNIGFGNSGTHTKGKSEVANLESREISFPLSHPFCVSRNVIADKLDDRIMFSAKPLYKKILDRLMV